MSTAKAPILVVGGTGTVGRHVVAGLVDAGARVRVLARSREKAAALGPVEVVVGDLEAPDTIADAFAGVERAFVAVSSSPSMATLQRNAFAAAERAGVRHVVNLSAQEAFMDHMRNAPLGRWIRESEADLRASGVAFTFLRPGAFASNVLMFGALEHGGVQLPGAQGREAPIDPADVAAVAVAALTTPGHEGKAYDLTGPELLTYGDMMEKLSAAIQKPLTYVDIAETEARRRFEAAGIPAPYVESILAHFVGVRAGCMTIASGVADVLGRPPRTFDAWARSVARSS